MSPAMRRHLLEIFDDHQGAQDLRLELAAVVDADVHFVSATYYLEDDTPLIFSCYERLCSVVHAVAVTPILQQLLVKFAVGMLPHTTSLWRKLKLISNQGLISISRNVAFNFVQSVLLRLHGSVVLYK